MSILSHIYGLNNMRICSIFWRLCSLSRWTATGGPGSVSRPRRKIIIFTLTWVLELCFYNIILRKKNVFLFVMNKHKKTGPILMKFGTEADETFKRNIGYFSIIVSPKRIRDESLVGTSFLRFSLEPFINLIDSCGNVTKFN